jgi:hypothetical protein
MMKSTPGFLLHVDDGIGSGHGPCSESGTKRMIANS